MTSTEPKSVNNRIVQTPCDLLITGDTTICKACDLTWDTNDPEPPKCRAPLKLAAGLTVTDDTLTTADGAEVIFDELKTIATGFLRRTKEVETQANQIIATVYMNAKKRAEDGDEWCAKLVALMDQEIVKLNALKGKYAVDFAARPLVAGPVPEVHGRHDG